MKAVEEGLNSESVKERIKALEKEKKHVKSKLFDITANYPEVTKQEVVAWLTGLKSGDIEDKKFQSELFNTFISAVYLYDDKRIKIVFGMPGGGKSTENSLPDDIDDLVENVCIGSSTGHHTLIPRMRSTSVFAGFAFFGFWLLPLICHLFQKNKWQTLIFDYFFVKIGRVLRRFLLDLAVRISVLGVLLPERESCRDRIAITSLCFLKHMAVTVQSRSDAGMS